MIALLIYVVQTPEPAANHSCQKKYNIYKKACGTYSIR